MTLESKLDSEPGQDNKRFRDFAMPGKTQLKRDILNFDQNISDDIQKLKGSSTIVYPTALQIHIF